MSTDDRLHFCTRCGEELPLGAIDRGAVRCAKCSFERREPFDWGNFFWGFFLFGLGVLVVVMAEPDHSKRKEAAKHAVLGMVAGALTLVLLFSICTGVALR